MALRALAAFGLVSVAAVASEDAVCPAGQVCDSDEVGLLSLKGGRVAVQKHEASPLASTCAGSGDPCSGNDCCPGIEATNMKSFPCPTADVHKAMCEVNFAQCPGSGNQCMGNQCCPGAETFPCPIADPTAMQGVCQADDIAAYAEPNAKFSPEMCKLFCFCHTQGKTTPPMFMNCAAYPFSDREAFNEYCHDSKHYSSDGVGACGCASGTGLGLQCPYVVGKKLGAHAPSWYVQPPSPCQCPGSGSLGAGFINGNGCPNGGGSGCCGIDRGDRCDGTGTSCLCSDGDEAHTSIIGKLQKDSRCQGGLCCIKNGAACNRCSCGGKTGNWGFCPTTRGGSNPRYGCCSNAHGVWMGDLSQCKNDSQNP